MPDASLDTAFGTHGAISRTISGFEFFLVVGIQASGRIIAAGGQSAISDGVQVFNVAVTGYTDAGAVDTTFGEQGHIELNFADQTGDITANQLPRDLVIDGQNRILIAGGVNGFQRDGQFFLVRYLPDGTLDPDFGDGGIVLTDFAAGDDEARSLVLLPDGKIIGAGYFANDVAIPSGIALARYLPDGTLDPSFGNAGTVIAPLGAINVAEALVVQPDGKFVVAGNANPALGLGTGFALVRFLSDGSVDMSFGSNGVAVLDFTAAPYADLRINNALVSDLVQLPNGQLVVGGTAFYDDTERTDLDFAVARFSAEGVVDTGFGSDGLVLTDFLDADGTPGPASDALNALAVQPDGKVVAVGDDFKVARYRTDTSVATEDVLPPGSVASLHAPFPNPLRTETTTLRFTLSRAGRMTLGIYDVLGRQVAALAEGSYSAGTHAVAFDAASLPAGVYFVRLAAEGQTLTQPMMRLR